MSAARLETKQEDVEQIRRELAGFGDHVSVDLWYPGHSSIKAIHVGLMHVRAADDIRIEYDFQRDGWVIKQASRFMWMAESECDPGWKEVAFVQAWARDERCCEQAIPMSEDTYECPEHGERKVARE